MFGFQQLEPRQLLAAEGVALDLSESVDTTGLVGAITSTIRWEDGSQANATVQGHNVPTSTPKFVFDYRYDTGPNRFFDTQAKKDLLELAGRVWTDRFTDNLSAIEPSGQNVWTAAFFHPQTGQQQLLENLVIGENEILVFVGARELSGNQRALAGPGGFGASGFPPWPSTVRGRGQDGAVPLVQTDSAPWGGFVTFDNRSTTDWYFGTNPDDIPFNGRDFFSFAVHELGHVLGLGYVAPDQVNPENPSGPLIEYVSPWEGFISTGSYTGPVANGLYPGSANIPIQPGEEKHWLEGITYAGRETLLDPSLAPSARTLANPIDLAAMDDIGWEVQSTQVNVNAALLFADDGVYNGEIVLEDSVGSVLTFPLSITVDNTPPMVDVSGVSSVVAGEPFQIDAVITDPGFLTETFTVDVDWNDGTEITSGDATITQAGNQSRPTRAQFNATHTFANAGTYTVKVTAKDDEGASQTQQLTVQVSNRQSLSAEFALTSIAENAGAESIEFILRRGTDETDEALVVQLSSSDNAAISYPQEVTIPSGQSALSVMMSPVDDDVLAAMRTVRITASATGYANAAAKIEVLDDENGFQNLTNRFNVDGNERVSAQDALLVINDLNSNGANRDLTMETPDTGGPRIDVNGDLRVSSLDALQVINELNASSAQGSQGESLISDIALTAWQVDEEKWLDETIAELF